MSGTIETIELPRPCRVRFTAASGPERLTLLLTVDDTLPIGAALRRLAQRSWRTGLWLLSHDCIKLPLYRLQEHEQRRLGPEYQAGWFLPLAVPPGALLGDPDGAAEATCSVALGLKAEMLGHNRAITAELQAGILE